MGWNVMGWDGMGKKENDESNNKTDRVIVAGSSE